jgi:hypothetical protein
MTAFRKIPLVIPEYVWGRLATIAERRNTNVSALIGDAIADLVDSDPTYVANRRILAPPASTPHGRSQLDILNDELNAARTDGYRAPGIHTQPGRKAS